MKLDKWIPPAIDQDCRLVRTRLGEYYLAIPCKDVTHNTQPQGRHEILSLDPGVRTFMTGYDPNGRVVELGTIKFASKTPCSNSAPLGVDANLRIERLCHHLDRLETKISNATTSKKRRYCGF